MDGTAFRRSREELLTQRTKFQDELKRVEHEIQSTRKKIGKSSNNSNITLKELEFERSTTTLSLQQEKNLIKKIEKIKQDQKLSQNVDLLKEKHKNIMITLSEIRKQIEDVESQERLAKLAGKLSQKKGGMPVQHDELVKAESSISNEKVGQFVGKQGNNLRRFEDRYCVRIEVSKSQPGVLVLTGLKDDVDSAKQAIEDFNNQVSKEMRVGTEELKMLKRNHAANMRSIESIMEVSITIVPSSFNNDGKKNVNDSKALKKDESNQVNGDIPELPIEKTAATLVIRGLPNNVLAACNAVRELAAFSTVFPFHVGSTSVRLLLDKSALLLKQLEQETGIAIDIDRKKHSIHLTGPEPQVKDAEKRLTSFFEKHEEHIRDLTFDEDSEELVSCIIGKGGSVIKTLQAKTGSAISVIRGEQGESRKPIIRLRATKDKMEEAVRQIQNTIEQYFKENVRLTFQNQHFAAINAIKEKLQTKADGRATLNLYRSFKTVKDVGEVDESATFNVYIRGEEETVSNVAKEMNELICAQKVEVLEFPQEATSTVIGAKGTTIMEIQSKSGTIISVKEGTAVIRGDAEQIEMAKQNIAQILEKFKEENLKCYVEPSILGTLIGKGGATLNRMREASGASIDIVKSHQQKDEVEQRDVVRDRYGIKVKAPLIKVRGEKEKANKAMKLIEEFLKDHGYELVSEKDADAFRENYVPIPSHESVRKLLGHHGNTIKELESKYNCRISILKKNQKVCVTGIAREEIVTAVQTVRDLLEQGMHVVEEITIANKEIPKLSSGALTRIQEDSNAVIEFIKATTEKMPSSNTARRDSSKDNKLKLSGSASAVRQAKDYINDHLLGVERLNLKILPLQMNEVLGQRSNFDRILDLCEDNHASIEVDQSRPTICLRGKPQTIEKIRSELLQFMQFFFPDNVRREILPSAAAIPVIIGKKGSLIRSLREEFDVNIEILRDDLLIYLSGSDKAKLTKATTQVQQLLSAWKKENVEIKVINEAIPSIIGKRGASIKSIQSESGVEGIEVDKTNGLIRIRGPEEAIKHAETIINKKIQQFRNENTVLEVEPKYIREIIGVKGATINNIQNESGARIRIDKHDCTAIITGDESSVVKAKQFILKTIEDAKSRENGIEDASLIQKIEQGRPASKELNEIEPKIVEDMVEESEDVEREIKSSKPFSTIPIGTPIELDTSSTVSRAQYDNRSKQGSLQTESPTATSQVDKILGLLDLAVFENDDSRVEEMNINCTHNEYDQRTISPPPGFAVQTEQENAVQAPPGFESHHGGVQTASLLVNDHEYNKYHSGDGYKLRLD